MTLTVGSLFSGIGGLELGLEMTGSFKTVWQVERDPWCRRVLAKHWPAVTRYEDVTTVDFAAVERVDVICGGFPCQNISKASVARTGISGEKSRLWADMYRAVCDVRPRFMLLENVAAITTAGLDVVTGDLAEIGYDAEWDCLPAAAFGAPHIRDRLYLLAYPRSERCWTHEETVFAGWSSSQLHGGWSREPAIRRVVDGIPSELDRARLRGLGNAVVPQVAHYIGQQIARAAEGR